MSQDLKIHSGDWARLVVLSLLWGGSFFCVGVAIKEVPPLTIVFLRVFIGAAILLPFALAIGLRLPSTAAQWKPFVVMSVLNNVIPFSLLAGAQYYVSSGMTSVLNATTPLFTVLVMAAFGEERLLPRRVAGVVMGLAGVVVLRGTGADLGSKETIGIIMGLAATLSFGFSALWAKRHMKGMPPLGLATFQLISSSLMMGVLAAAIERPWQLPLPGTASLLAIAAIGILSTGLGFIVFFQIIARSGPSNVMLVTLMVPVSAILLGYLFLNETIAARECAGALMIAAALLVMDGRMFEALRRRPAIAD